ncbi:MAG TPA: hypothetical protein VL172_03280 [Kofleriaceae bacterium]|nr:hypothetical protein [Kofleriaceae bacterium]
MPAQRDLFALIEMGSNSLKLYLVPPAADAAEIETLKFSWPIGHELYRGGGLSPASADQVLDCVIQAGRVTVERGAAGVLAIATGVFRELPDLDALAARIEAETGIRPRVISGQDEAALMARGFRELAIAAPAVMVDLGGASLEWAWMPQAGTVRSGSLPLGAIRNKYRFADREGDPAGYLEASRAHCDQALATLPITGRARVVATGGTAEAMAACVGREQVTAAELDALIERVQRDGAPAELKPARRPVLLPGLIILSRVIARCGADRIAYGTSAVRQGMVRRLIQLLERFPPGQLRATQLLRQTQIKP